MDERKKTIGDLERKKLECQGSLDIISENFGEILFSRIGDGKNPPEEAVEYRRLGKEIVDFNAAITTVEEDTLRLQNLEDEIQFKEQQRTSRAAEISESYVKLGRLILEDPEYEVPAAVYQQQAKVLCAKIAALEDRLEELDDKDGNVFVLLGKSVQSLVTGSSLKKNQKNLERLYRTAGEKFSGDGSDTEPGGEIAGLTGSIKNENELLKNLEAEIVVLREEKGKITSSFSEHGGPARYIQELGKNISKTKERQKVISRRFGENAADFSISKTGRTAKKKVFAELITSDDKQILEKIKSARKAISEYETGIKKLTAAIAIDEEKSLIEKSKKSIEAEKRRIAAAEQSIAESEGRIVSSEKHISELEKDL